MVGIMIRGGSGHKIGDNNIIGYADGIVIEDSKDSIISNNYVSSSISDDLTLLKKFIAAQHEDSKESQTKISEEIRNMNTNMSNISLIHAIERILASSSNAVRIAQFISSLAYLSSYLPK